ncbi:MULTISPECIES: hypothetical protein [unclassified Nostoc]|nr:MULTISPECIES: hypothetical protein [unclassified Nostoc]
MEILSDTPYYELSPQVIQRLSYPTSSKKFAAADDSAKSAYIH